MANGKESLILTEENFKSEVLDSPKPVVVDFWADWCGPCHLLAPAMEQLTADFEGAAKVGKVDVDDQQALAVRFGIQSIPTLLFFQNGKVVDRAIGVVPTEVLSDKLTALLPAA